ncbi:hypothetical protein Gotur_015036 [Gossypium turneri]
MYSPELNSVLESLSWKRDFLIKWKTIRSCEYGSRKDNKRKVTICRRGICQNYRISPYLLDVKVDKYLFRALTQYWNPAYSYFTFEKVDLMPTVEEYTTFLC